MRLKKAFYLNSYFELGNFYFLVCKGFMLFWFFDDLKGFCNNILVIKTFELNIFHWWKINFDFTCLSFLWFFSFDSTKMVKFFSLVKPSKKCNMLLKYFKGFEILFSKQLPFCFRVVFEKSNSFNMVFFRHKFLLKGFFV